MAALTVNSSNAIVSAAYTSYDPVGRVASTTQCHPNVTGCKTFTVNNYDKLGDPTSLTYPGTALRLPTDMTARPGLPALRIPMA